MHQPVERCVRGGALSWTIRDDLPGMSMSLPVILDIRFVSLPDRRRGVTVTGPENNIPIEVGVFDPPGDGTRPTTYHGSVVWLEGENLCIEYKDRVYPLFTVCGGVALVMGPEPDGLVAKGRLHFQALPRELGGSELLYFQTHLCLEDRIHT